MHGLSPPLEDKPNRQNKDTHEEPRGKGLCPAQNGKPIMFHQEHHSHSASDYPGSHTAARQQWSPVQPPGAYFQSLSIVVHSQSSHFLLRLLQTAPVSVRLSCISPRAILLDRGRAKHIAT